MELESAQKIANEVVKRLSPYCQRIEVAGSIRRRKPQVKDIDLVLISHDRWNMDSVLLRMGSLQMAGSKISRVTMDSIPLDIYFATPETFATLLLIRTGSVQNNIRLCSLAKKKGWRLAASGDGLFDENGERIAWQSEEEIFNRLGLPYVLPEQRE